MVGIYNAAETGAILFVCLSPLDVKHVRYGGAISTNLAFAANFLCADWKLPMKT